ncbi:dihydrofolate reductase family protein [Nocardia beijingensis]|uniref:dihydrofolate reductase family protein n=1 Tax=Nocardia beijingensis TaxID=95162 RepID=UPI001894B9F4|nr:dihydrofolate reductase family protein [Nocardia beijingensis]MBF6467939.1 dihydrofolate reductase family protein [Nocardia beijingensis]
MRKLVYYVAVSLDGYIAGPQGEYDFYPFDEDMMAWINPRYPETVPTQIRESVGMALDTPNKTLDTVLMGRGAYEPGLAQGATSPYNHLKQYVFSSTLPPVDNPQVEVVDTDPVELVRRLKKEEGLDIWLCGGGNLAGQLLGEVDKLIIKSYPVLAGDGIGVFTGNFQPTQFKVGQRKEFSSGAQMTWFDRA